MIDPAELDELIAAQRQRCRDAGLEWEEAAAAAAEMDLAAAVYGRQAVVARERAATAMGAHSGHLSRLWELESQRG